MGQRLESDQHLLASLAQRLARPQSERHTGPTPVIDLDYELRKRLSISGRVDTRLSRVVGHVASINRAVGVAGLASGRSTASALAIGSIATSASTCSRWL